MSFHTSMDKCLVKNKLFLQESFILNKRLLNEIAMNIWIRYVIELYYHMPLLPQWCADYFQPQSLDGFEKLISTIKSEYLIIRRWVDSLKKVLIIELINLGQAHKFGWKAANWTWNSSHHHSLFEGSTLSTCRVCRIQNNWNLQDGDHSLKIVFITNHVLSIRCSKAIIFRTNIIS